MRIERTEMRQAVSWVAVFCVVVSAATGSQLPSHEGTKFNRLGMTSGVTKSGASWEGTLYETASGARVRLTIVHLNSREGAKNEYADWLKLKGVRIISKGKVQGKLPRNLLRLKTGPLSNMPSRASAMREPPYLLPPELYSA